MHDSERQQLADHLSRAAQRLEALAASLDFPDRDAGGAEAMPAAEQKIRFADARP